jgi:hypothetical protein
MLKNLIIALTQPGECNPDFHALFLNTFSHLDLDIYLEVFQPKFCIRFLIHVYYRSLQFHPSSIDHSSNYQP